ncbi:MAG: hypothetical protein ABW221_21535 [Vicinamibacteria bacterium]
MGWSDIPAKDRTRTLARADQLGLSEAQLSSKEDLVVSQAGLTLDARRPGKLKPSKLTLKDAGDLVRYYGHPEATQSNRVAALRQNERRAVLRAFNELERDREKDHNFQGRTLNHALTALQRRSLRPNELRAEYVQQLDQIAGRVTGIIWFLPNIVIEPNATLEFSGSGPHSLVANKITIKPGGRIVGNLATVQISCNTLEVQ